jgi:hypothetical protein
MPRPSGSSETLKNEEIDGTRYRDHRDAADHIGAFVDQVYKRQRLHSALGYQTPVAFEAEHRAQGLATAPLTDRVFKGCDAGEHREFPAGYPSAGCSPADRASASPAAPGYDRRPSWHDRCRSACPHFSVSPMGCSAPSRLSSLFLQRIYSQLITPAIGLEESDDFGA